MSFGKDYPPVLLAAAKDTAGWLILGVKYGLFEIRTPLKSCPQP
jgi:hypothetical protein